jgi:hypothetical protein
MSTMTTVEAPKDNAGVFTQARIFVNQWGKDAAVEMLETIKRIKKRSNLITKLVLAASMPHQVGYLLSEGIPYMFWHDGPQIALSLTLILMSVVVPVGCDLMILNCIETLGARAAAWGWRWAALGIMLIPAGASGFVNFLAPGPPIIRILSGFAVALIPMSQVLRFVRPDFKKVEAEEVSMIAEVVGTKEEPPAPPAPPTKKIDGVLAILREAPHLTAIQAKTLYEQRYGVISYNYVADTVNKVRNGVLVVA